MIKLISVRVSAFQRTADNLKVENLFYQQKQDKKPLRTKSPFSLSFEVKKPIKRKMIKGKFLQFNDKRKIL